MLVIGWGWSAGSVRAEDKPAEPSRPLSYTVSWIGNTFPGTDETGWVQNHISEVAITPDGTIYASSRWDEAGRCVGAYKDGKVNRRLFQQYNGQGGHKAWGWGTASDAIAADAEYLYVVNTEGELLRFRRSDSSYVDQKRIGPALDMAYQSGELVLIRPDREVVRLRAKDGAIVGQFRLPGTGALAAGAADVAVDASGRIWLRLGKQVRAYEPNGQPRPEVIEDLDDPSDLAITPNGQLVVCDNGQRNQVLFYDISGPQPKLVETFGRRGGLLAGTPGVVEGQPDKLFVLRGANTDAEGNLYVAMGKNLSIFRKYDRQRRLVWEVASLFFVDGTSILPGSDGREIYSREEIITFDYDAPAESRAWKLHAVTADFDRHPNDPRHDPAGMGRIRLVQGRRLLFVSGMMGGPMRVFTFEEPTRSQIARDTGLQKGDGWANWPDTQGGIWYVKNQRLVYEPLTGFEPTGRPIYGPARTWPLPPEFISVERILYDPPTDRMILTGFTRQHPDPGGAWGLVGTEMFCYDNWLRGAQLRWRIPLPFKTWQGGGPHEMIMPKSLDYAGDYVFVAYVSNGVGTGNKPPVRVYRLADGQYVGDLRPGGVVGSRHGWVDMVHAISAFQRSNGEYVILVEEDYRGKNVLYRWKPEPTPPKKGSSPHE